MEGDYFDYEINSPENEIEGTILAMRRSNPLNRKWKGSFCL